MRSGFELPEDAATADRDKGLVLALFQNALWQGVLVFLSFSLLPFETALIICIAVATIAQAVTTFGILVQNQVWAIALLNFRNAIATDRSHREPEVGFDQHLKAANEYSAQRDPLALPEKAFATSLAETLISVATSILLILGVGWLGTLAKPEMTQMVERLFH